MYIAWYILKRYRELINFIDQGKIRTLCKNDVVAEIDK